MFDLLEKYKIVVESGNITKASKKLFITQPALSLAIKQLEKELKAKLLERSKSGVKPTKIGQIVYEFSNESLLSLENLRSKIAYNKNQEINLNVGMIDNASRFFIKNIYPKSQFQQNIIVNNTSKLLDQVERGELDFAIITKPKDKISSKFSLESIGKEKLVLVGLKKFRKLNAELPIISFNKSSNTHRLINEFLSNSKIRYKFVTFSTNPEIIKEMSTQGVGVAVLPQNFVEQELKSGKLYIIDESFYGFRKLMLVYLKDKFIREDLEKYFELIRNEFGKLS